jgi:hypothetical protein
MESKTIILNTDDYITDLFEKGIIDAETYYDSMEHLTYTECEEDFTPEQQYIYMVVIDKKKKLYFLNPEDTHWTFDIPKSRIYYIRVLTESPQYQSAFYNSKTNNIIKIEKDQVKEKNKIQLNLYESSREI